MLHIQSELKSGKTIPEICDPLGIEYTEKDGKVILSYDQIESPKNHPIVKECRGLILYTSDFSIACFPFERFLNYGETGCDVLPSTLADCLVLPKLDGSMANLWFDKTSDKWTVSTRKMVYAEGPVGPLSDKTFAELFWEAFENSVARSVLDDASIGWLKYCTYTFELTSPFNRIVTPYKDTSVTLLTYRNNDTINEASNIQVFRLSGNSGIKCIRPIKMSDWKELLKMQNLAATDEGFVVVKESKEGSHKRVKVKNPAYLSISRLISSTSERAFIELIKRNEQDEVISYFPEYKDNFDKLILGLRKVEEIIKKDWLELYQIEDRKAFALEAVKRKYPSILFSMKDNKITKLSTDLLLLKTDALLQMIKVADK